MSRDKSNTSTTSVNLASLIRGLYGRVARQLKVDPSYVSRVARGERRSDEIEASLERELKRITSMVKMNHNGRGGHKRVAVTKAKAKNKKKARASA
jgi:hypothetical protein